MDGVILTSPQSYEPESTAAMKRWFADTGRPVYLCGPLLPGASKAAAVENEVKQSANGAEIQAFLDEVLDARGEKSLLYVCDHLVFKHGCHAHMNVAQISLGSFFWPVNTPEKMWAFLDIVMELQIPFVSVSHQRSCGRTDHCEL